MPDPILVRRGTALTTSEQVRERLFCDECEQLMGKADRYCSELAYQDGVSPLRNLIWVLPTPLPHLMPLWGVEVDLLVRFAIGVFFRAHCSKSLPLTLDSAEDCRRHLHERTTLPSSIWLAVTFYRDWREHFPDAHGMYGVDRLVVDPQTNHNGDHFLHWFMLAGLKFELVERTSGPEPSIGSACLLHSRTPMLSVEDPLGSGWIQMMLSQLKNAQPKGKLATVFERELRRQGDGSFRRA